MFEISISTLWLFGAVCFLIGFVICAVFAAGESRHDWRRQ